MKSQLWPCIKVLMQVRLNTLSEEILNKFTLRSISTQQRTICMFCVLVSHLMLSLVFDLAVSLWDIRFSVWEILPPGRLSISEGKTFLMTGKLFDISRILNWCVKDSYFSCFCLVNKALKISIFRDVHRMLPFQISLWLRSPLTTWIDYMRIMING